MVTTDFLKFSSDQQARKQEQRIQDHDDPGPATDARCQSNFAIPKGTIVAAFVFECLVQIRICQELSILTRTIKHPENCHGSSSSSDLFAHPNLELYNKAPHYCTPLQLLPQITLQRWQFLSLISLCSS
ncbi:uncharacterized protein LOC112342045 [Selaginella moellendorffii]|uniref:uncharacterized protein LOC112342045 n=1 Tax=Selaginella moellendorffii TaxID=88036 RepID=UPI000D1C3BBB|nr:uncharacterized protein LOC112342045 [Selaginella moellendorffii]|eukprot:XP_024518972.1 uncharacterized protein LOC112342045 [Selaginella moellendorffii]